MHRREDLNYNLFILLPSSPSSHSKVIFFFPVGLSSFSRHFQQVLLGVEFSSVLKKLQHPIRSVENVVITTKGLEERKTQLLSGTMVKRAIKMN